VIQKQRKTNTVILCREFNNCSFQRNLNRGKIDEQILVISIKITILKRVFQHYLKVVFPFITFNVYGTKPKIEWANEKHKYNNSTFKLND
jgi:hypothetical protein